MKKWKRKKMVKKIILLIIGCFTILVSEPQETKRVFIVASYSKTHVCGWPQEEGVIKGLNKLGYFESMNLSIKRFYMNTKKVNTSKELMKKQAEIALNEISKFKPYIVVVLDDNAFREVALPLCGDKTIKIVFSGMNGQVNYYNSIKSFSNNKIPTSNITGIYEKLYVYRSIKVLQSAVPSIKQKTFVGITDFSPTGNAITKQFELELKNKLQEINWELKRVKNWDEYKNLIQEINKNDEIGAIYPVALSLKVSETLTYTAPEIFKWTIENNRKPEMALNYYFAKMGLFGGAAVDFHNMGFQAGKMAGELLDGVQIQNIPIVDAEEYAIVFNIKRAKKLGIKIPAPLLTAADFIYKE